MIDRRKGVKRGPLVFIEMEDTLYINMCPARKMYSWHCIYNSRYLFLGFKKQQG